MIQDREGLASGTGMVAVGADCWVPYAIRGADSDARVEVAADAEETLLWPVRSKVMEGGR